MAFPQTPLSVVIEFWDGTQWVDITDYVLVRNGIQIRRGFPDEGTSPEPGSMTLTLNNRDGRFSPRNPSSPYYGLIGRNTPMRVTIDEASIATGDQIRFVGEVSEWPSRWDISGRDVWVDVTAQGVLRRLGQGRTPLKSAVRRYLSQDTGLRAWWPMEDDTLANRTTPGSPGIEVANLAVGYSAVGGPAGSNGAVFLSSPSSIVNEAEVYNGVLRLPVAKYTPSSGSLTVGFLFRQDRPAQLSSATGRAPIGGSIFIPTDGTVGFLAFQWLSDPDSILTGTAATFGNGSPAVGATAAVDICDGEWHAIVCLVQTSGSDLNAFLYVDDDLQDGAVLSTVTLGTVTELNDFGTTYFNPDTLVNHPWSFDIAHVAVWDQTAAPGLSSAPYPAIEVVNGWAGEPAHERVERIADEEEGLTLSVQGSESTSMGPQGQKAYLEIIEDAWRADLAVLFEDRDSSSLIFRTRADLYNQTTTVELDYEGSGEIAKLDPTDDDQHVRNDITVRRTGGQEFRVTKDSGPLSTQAPPDGVGTYDEQIEVNVASDDQLEGQAHWRLFVGTWDELRYPIVGVDMTALAAAGKASLMANVAALDVGDRIRLTNLPAWLPPGPVDLMALGFRETIGHPTEWTIALILVPYGPYVIAVAEDSSDPGETRIGSDGSTVNTDFDSGTDTSLSVAVATGYPLWQTGSVDFDIQASGVRLHVTNISGASSPQTFTVDATPVNGVEKTIPAGAAVELAELSYYGL